MPRNGMVERTLVVSIGNPRLMKNWGSRRLVWELAQLTPMLATMTAKTLGLDKILRTGIFLSLGRQLEVIVSSRNISLSGSDVSRDLDGSS